LKRDEIGGFYANERGASAISLQGNKEWGGRLGGIGFPMAKLDAAASAILRYGKTKNSLTGEAGFG
jgi:hypothetical protein